MLGAADLFPDEARFLSSLMQRAYRTVLRPPQRVDLCTNKSRSRHDQDDPHRVRSIACFSFELPNPSDYVADWPNLLPLVRGTAYRGVCFDTRECAAARGLCERIPQQVGAFLSSQRKLRRHVDFVLANELAISFDGAARDDLLDRWRKIAAEHDTYVIPGTFHNEADGTGVAPIFGPLDAGNRRTPEWTTLKQNTAFRHRPHFLEARAACP